MFDALGLGLADIIGESIELAFHRSIMPAQYVGQRRDRRISWIVPRHLREFVAQGQPQLEFQIIAHSVMPFRYGLALLLLRPYGHALTSPSSTMVSILN
jgi:hypothetical protein